MITKLGNEAKKELENSNLANYAASTAGISAIGAGNYIAATELINNKKDITGREKLYHGTNPDYVEAIYDKGILPSTNENAGMTKVLDIAENGDIYKKSLGNAYLSDTPDLASEFVANHNYAKKKNVDLHSLSPEELKAFNIQKALDPAFAFELLDAPNSKGMIEVNAPLWKLKDNMIINPEAADDTAEDYIKRLSNRADIQEALKANGRSEFNDLEKTMLRKQYDQLHNHTKVFKGGIAPEYVVGSDKYKRLGIGELVDYIVHNPKRFGKGIAGVAGGLGLTGLGAYGIYRGSVKEDL